MPKITKWFQKRSRSSPSSSPASEIIIVNTQHRDTSTDDRIDVAAKATRREATRHSTTGPLNNVKRRQSTRDTCPKQANDAILAPGKVSGSPIVKRQKSSIRTISGETLVEDLTESKTKILDDGIKALDMEWSIDVAGNMKDIKSEDIDQKISRRKSTRLGQLVHDTSDAVTAVGKSILGKRGREILQEGRGKLERMSSTKLNRRASLRPKSEILDYKAEKVIEAPKEDGPLRKKLKTAFFSAPNLLAGSKRPAEDDMETISLLPKPKKRWLSAGIYVGQSDDFKASLTGAQNKKKRASTGKSTACRKSADALPLPMFNGDTLLKTGRPFRLPYDIYSPLPNGGPKPEQYRKTQSNRFIGDSKSEWKKMAKLPDSLCVCTDEEGCAEACLNRIMGYECDDKNCAIGRESCTNRQFADLSDRIKTGRKFDIGVEVVKTENKGFGVRACRSFNPGQIIIEYAGEIITQDECDRRVRNEYKKAECFYLMEFAQNMILDATRGSIARFVNHSCEPNCGMEKWTVSGIPRMALFAGPRGVMTGEELTYDYNFDPFSQKKVQKCYCGTEKCRGTLGPKRKT